MRGEREGGVVEIDYLEKIIFASNILRLNFCSELMIFSIPLIRLETENFVHFEKLIGIFFNLPFF